MALAKNLEDLLKHMSAGDAEKQRKIWEENPEIAKSVDQFFVPHAEFSRQLALKDQEVKESKDLAKEWEDWAKKNKPKHEQMVKEYADLETKYRDAQEALKKGAREAAEESGLDATELATKVLEQVKGKTLTLDQLNAAIEQERTKMLGETKALLDNTRKDFLEKTFPQVTAFQADLLEIMQDHKDEFKEKLDRKAFSQYMQDNQMTDPRKAYEQWIAPRKSKVSEDARVEQRVSEELAKRNVPGVSSTSSSPADRGPLELKIAGQTPTFAEGTSLGDLSAAAMAAKEMRTEGVV